MPIDYVKLAGVATRLIGENGREVLLKRQSQTLADPARPWGPSATTGGSSVPVTAVFLDPERRQTTSGDIQPSAQLEEFKRVRVLIAASEAGLPAEVGPDWYIEDGARRLEIVISRPVKPGGLLLYYDIEARV